LDLLHDAEVVSVIASVFRGLGLPGFEIRLSNRMVLSSVLAHWGIGGGDSARFLRIIDKHGPQGADAVRDALAEEKAPGELVSLLGELLKLEDLDSAERLLTDAEIDPGGVHALREVVEAAARLGVGRDEFRVDLSIARGLDYYTGTVYETFLSGREEWGSVCSGGRFDDLAGYFTDRALPGVGVSIGLTRLLDLLVQNEQIELESSSPTRVLVAVQDRDSLDSCLRVAALLREGEVPTEVYMQARRLGEQLAYASALDIPFAAIIGAAEAAGDFVTLRDLRAGTQEVVEFSDLLNRVTGIGEGEA